MLDSRQLAQAQAFATKTLDLTCTVQRNTPAADGMGGFTESWANIATGVTCSLATPRAGLMQAYASLLGTLETWLVSAPIAQDVRENDRIIVGGLTLRVQVIFAPESYAILLTFLASEVR